MNAILGISFNIWSLTPADNLGGLLSETLVLTDSEQSIDIRILPSIQFKANW